MTETFNTTNIRGSLWHRCDPHIHTPGTALNNGYSGDESWDGFPSKIETGLPPIRALGITDYCGIEKYVETLAKQREGRLPGVGLIFPNVELRSKLKRARGLTHIFCSHPMIQTMFLGLVLIKPSIQNVANPPMPKSSRYPSYFNLSHSLEILKLRMRIASPAVDIRRLWGA
nr:hypothetical protein [Herbaspirillum huttiense]